jgi:hypothetical protein
VVNAIWNNVIIDSKCVLKSKVGELAGVRVEEILAVDLTGTDVQ